MQSRASPPDQRRDVGRDRLHHRVHDVGAHGVADVDDQVQHQDRAARRRRRARAARWPARRRPAGPCSDARHPPRRGGAARRPRGVPGAAARSGTPSRWIWPIMHRRVGVGDEAPRPRAPGVPRSSRRPPPRAPRSAIGTSRSRPLMRKLSPTPEREAEDADGVLDHVVGGLEGQGLADRPGRASRRPRGRLLREPRQPIGATQSAEAGDPGSCNAARLVFWIWALVC